MHPTSLSLLEPMRQLPVEEVESDLLELFAPAHPPTPAAGGALRTGRAALWRADAVHRAKNMAQMAISLANVADHPSRRWLPPEVTAQARRLARAYEELGIDDGATAPVPCAALLADIATRLTDIFGRSRRVSVILSVEPVSLPPAMRRALLLIASELVINALKYGYATGRGGTISVSLTAARGTVGLTVEDDGAGAVDLYAGGQGGGLLERLAAVIGASVARSAGAAGRGFRVSISMPVDTPPGAET